MIALLATAVGLGAAGLDPSGALFAAALLAAGARERHVAAYGVTSLVGTIVLGTTLSLTVGPSVGDIDWGVLYPGDLGSTLLEAAFGVALLAWGALRIVQPATRSPRPRSTRRTGAAALVVLGFAFALMAILDPTFVALAVIAGRDGGFPTIVASHTIWIVLSQAPLVVFLVAMARGRHERFVGWLQSWWARARPGVVRVLNLAAVVVGALFLADAGWWFATGRWLLYN